MHINNAKKQVAFYSSDVVFSVGFRVKSPRGTHYRQWAIRNLKNIVFKGGAQWMGASIDNATSTMYVNSSDIPTFLWLERVDKINSYYRYSSNMEIIKDQYGYPGSKPPWGNLTSIDLTDGKINWTVPFGEYEKLTKKNIPITGTVNFGGVVATAGNLVFATGTVDNKVRAYRATDGKELWSYKMKYLGSSPPTIFEYNKGER